MAKQHFYSRVPARMSLFQKIDGYDTFAYSDGLTREFIEKELSAVYDIKNVKEEAETGRSNPLPPIYCRFCTQDGQMIQSSVGFLSSDYTGERSSYLVHSLVLSPEEKKEHLEGMDAAALDEGVFQADLSAFDLTSFDAVTYRDYPEVSVAVKKAEPTASIPEQYDTGMLKRLIYAMLAVSCGKAKALFFSLHADANTLSAKSLAFLNRMLTIFPYNMREALSFVTYAGDPAKFSSFKIRCVSENLPEIPTSKGITIKLDAKEYVGISDENIAANAKIVDFFYSLLSNDKMRREFLAFSDHAMKQNPALAKCTLKNLDDLVLLFKTLSGFFEEKNVLPNDDAVYDYVTIYEKNRESLPESSRVKGLQCLGRYVETQTAIPKNIFAKVVRIYPTEPEASKHTVMDFSLELIHTDAMRDKLFAFIKSNYETEDKKTQKKIMSDFCRVYYGGFLQNQILPFFDEHFENEPADTRCNILERLLLTVRTPSVQNAVLDFVKKYYPIFTSEEKDKFYKTFYEMLPEADDLSRAMADIVDDCVEEERKEAVAGKILAAVETDEKHSQPQLCEALAVKCGFTEQVLIRQIFGKWNKRKIVDTFLSAVCKKDFTNRILTVDEIWSVSPDMGEELSDRLLSSLKESFKNSVKANIFTVTGAIDTLEKRKKETPQSQNFIESLEKDSLYPAAATSIPSAFDYKRFPNGVEELAELASNRPYLTECPAFSDVSRYMAALDAAKAGNGEKVFSETVSIEGEIPRLGTAEQFKKKLFVGEIGDENTLIFTLCVGYLKSGELKITDAANAVRDVIMRRERAASNSTDVEAIAKTVDEKTLSVVLQTVVKLYRCDLPETVKDLFTAENNEIGKYLTTFVNRYEKKGKKILSEQIGALPEAGQLTDMLRQTADTKSSSDGFFKKLFKK